MTRKDRLKTKWSAFLSVPLVATTLLLSGVTLAQSKAKPSVPTFKKVESPPIFPLGEIERGQRGYGYTVFASARGAEPFEFEVLGVMPGFLGPGEDLIIVRLIGEQIERTGVISGMSGSPAYIDGKLVGAVGYRLGSFTKDPIAGITPIQRMLKNDAPLSKRSAQKLSPDAFGSVRPIGVPISTSQLSPHVASAFAEELEKRGYGAMVAGGAASAGVSDAVRGKRAKAETSLYAAGPISGVIVNGDITMAGVGTVTWVKGKKFLAFGHPFMGIGETSMPVGSANILTTVATPAGSYKLGHATKIIGRLTNDRLHAITGTVGDIASMIPVVVNLDLAGINAKNDALKTLRYEVFRHPTDAPLFAAIALANALSGRVGIEQEGGTADVKGVIVLKNGVEIPFSTRAVAEGSSVDIAAAQALMAEWNQVKFNGFEDVEIKNVRLSVKTQAEIVLKNVDRVTPRSSAQAGQKLRVDVEWTPYKKPSRVRTYDVVVPKGLAPGKYTLTVAGTLAAGRFERAKGLTPKVESFANFLEVRSAFPPEGTLSFYLTGKGQRLSVSGRTLGEIPSSLEGLMAGATDTKTRDSFTRRIARNAYEGVIFGDASATLIIEEGPQP